MLWGKPSLVPGGDTQSAFVKTQSYYGMVSDGLSLMAKHVLSTPDGRSTILTIEFALPPKLRDTFLQADTSYCDVNAPPSLSVSYSSVDMISRELIVGTMNDIHFMHKFIGPLAMLILALFLGNLPIMIIPILTIISSMLASLVLMYPLSLGKPVAPVVPGAMVSIIVALSIDYSLFLLSRCAEDVARGMDRKAAIASMVEHSGHTVAVSAFTLTGCSLGLLLFRVDMISM